MIQLQITRSEAQCGRLLPVHLAAAVRAIDEDGFVILNSVIDVAHVDAVYGAMIEDIHKRIAQHGAVAGFSNVPPRRQTNLLFKDIVMNPLCAQVNAAIMGERVSCGMYTSNVTMPDTGDQDLHVDQAPLKEGETIDYPCNCVVVNVPLVDFTLENGATEIWPGTHKIPRPVGEFWVNQAIQDKRRSERPPERAVMPRGSLLIRDIRLWHRGTPNKTHIIRPMVGMIMNGGFVPVMDPLSKIPVAGQFPKDSEPFFRDNPAIFYNVEYV